MKSRRSRVLPIGGTLAALALGTLTYAAPAATAAPGDTVSVNNENQLRRAVFRANQGTGAETIKLRRNIMLKRDGNGGTFQGDIDVTGDVTILGQGKFISARRIDRHFDVRPGASLELRRVLLVNGQAPRGESGGSIRSQGELTIRNSRIIKSRVRGAGASGGGIFNDGGDLVISASRVNRNSAVRAGGGIEVEGGSTFIRESRMADNNAGTGPGNGGALHTTGDGDVTIVGGFVRNNTAVEGGGLWNSDSGRLVVRRTEITNNTATGTNTGDATDAGGGGVYNDGGALVLRKTQVIGNQATGASASGGGVLNKGDMVASTSEFTGNSTSRAGGGIEGATGSSTDVDNSTITNNTVGTAPGNGGGAHFAGDTDATVVGTQVTGNEAGSEGGGLWTAGTLMVDGSTVRNNTAAGDAAENGGGGLYNDGGDLSVMNSMVQGNSATGAAGSGGGALNNEGTLTVVETTVGGNAANRAGGGIEAAGGDTTIRRSSLVNNDAGANPGNGGGLHVGGDGTSVVSLSLVEGNTAVEGGGLWNSGDGDMTVRRSEVLNNTATGTNTGDATDAGGGGIYNDGGTLLVGGTELMGNSATGESASGGGLLNNGGEVTVQYSEIDENDATRAGGGIETAGDATSTLSVVGTDITGNTTGDNPGNGGGIHIGGDALVTLNDDVNITENVAANEGGGVWVNGNSDDQPNQFDANGANITNNTPDDVYYNGDDVAITN